MEVSLKEISKIVTGNTPSKKNKDYWNSEDICFIKPDVIGSGIDSITTSNEYISNFASSKARIVDRNTILITCIGNIGRIGIVSDKKVAFNQQINAIIPDYKINIRYLAYVLLFSQPRLNALANSAVVPIVNKTQLGNFKVKINPNLESQRKIVSILDKIAKIIKNQTKEIEHLDELIKARFVEMFGNLKHNKKYKYKKISELTDVISGGTPNRKNESYWQNGTIPWIKTTELKNNRIFSTDECITTLGLEHSSAKIVPPHTVLIAMYGQGKTRAMTAYLETSASTNQACACILPSSNIDSEYLWQYLILSYHDLRSRAKGGNQPNLNSQIIKNFEILVPPISLQNEFANFVQQVDKSKVAVQKSLDETQKLYDSLMQEYFG
ncbi:restriction endonuclease subunit S [Lactobacillus johnsonii]|uniref:restriction endonuclease subunit S n=1 Tax=Lactobacillus johnsonii TaxID=33959 RepID=UPI003F51A5C5